MNYKDLNTLKEFGIFSIFVIAIQSTVVDHYLNILRCVLLPYLATLMFYISE